MLRVLFISALVGVSLAGRSPNADFIDQLAAPGGRYSNDILLDARLDVPGLVRRYGYPLDVHEVVTEDGYILTTHRIPHGRDRNNQPGVERPVVFVMHGLTSSSADFLLLGPGNALGYLLAEEGYDVWLGNARGNYYSRRHRTMNPDSILNQNFWQFSWDEIGNYDLPAFLDHIESVTGQSKLHYIGHSQGGTTFLVLNALRPEYADRFISFQGLAPAAFFRYNQNRMYHALAPMERQLVNAMFALRRAEFFRNRESVTWFASKFCYQGSVFSPLCASVVVRGTSSHFNQTMIPVFLGHSPAGASVRQPAHYGQGINNDSFRRYDHGLIANLRIYGSRTPPDYDISRVSTICHLHYSWNDVATYWKDIELLASRLPNAQLHKVDSKDFDHLDFIWGNGVRDLLYNNVLRLMREAENQV